MVKFVPLTSNQKWFFIITNKLADWMAIDIVRCINGTDLCVASTSDGAMSAKAWLINWPASSLVELITDDVALDRLTIGLQIKIAEVAAHWRNWSCRYERASPAALEHAQDMFSDVIRSPVMECQMHWCHRMGKEYIFLECWLPEDPVDMFPAMVIQQYISQKDACAILFEANRVPVGIRMFESLPDFGFVKLMMPTSQVTSFGIDMPDLVADLRQHRSEVVTFADGWVSQ